MLRSFLILFCVMATWCFGWSRTGAWETPTQNLSRLRRPVAAVLSADERLLYTANRRSGSMSVLDLEARRVVAEHDLGGRLTDLAPVNDGRLMLATDEERHELLLLDVDGSRLSVRQRLPIAPYPINVVVSRDAPRAFVASLWSRRLTFVDLPVDDRGEAVTANVVDLEIAPGRQLLVRDDTRLIIADMFADRLVVVNAQTGTIQGGRRFPAHNMRGMGTSVDGSMLVVAHQMLNELAHTVRNDVHWGLLMSNDLRWLRLDAVLDESQNLYEGAHMHPLGEANSATADPEELVVTREGTVIVTLGGVGEIAFGHEDDFSLKRLKVGRRPTALAVSRDGHFAYVANTFGESISIVDLEERKQIAEIPLGPTAELSLADQGELLFFDGSLSHDGWMTCNSCHTIGHTNGMLNDNLSDTTFGAPKRVLSLLGKADTAPFAWNGAVERLEQQIRNSIEKTMQLSEPPADEQVAALAAFLRSLEPPPSVDRLRGRWDQPAIDRGRALFEALDCRACHAPPTYTTPDVYDVGLKDKLGNHEFNPPSLRGVGQRGPYFHDASAATLRDVFEVHGHQLPGTLEPNQLDDLLAFLRSL